MTAVTLAPAHPFVVDGGVEVDIVPIAGVLGAEVRGLDPTRLDEVAAAALRQALDDHLVLFLPGLHPTVEQLGDKTAASGFYGVAGFEF